MVTKGAAVNEGSTLTYDSYMMRAKGVCSLSLSDRPSRAGLYRATLFRRGPVCWRILSQRHAEPYQTAGRG